MTDFLKKDIKYTLKDAEFTQKEQAKQAVGALNELNDHQEQMKRNYEDRLNEKLDGFMANVIRA